MPSLPIDTQPAAPPAPVRLWTCIGCGAMGMADVCTGDCSDRAVEFVRAAEHDAVLTGTAAAREWAADARDFARAVAAAEPADGDWEPTWRDWQRAARALAGRQPEHPAAVPVERVSTWWCASCGRVEAPQTCLGVCLRQYDYWVPADEHARAAAAAAGELGETAPFRALVEQLAHVSPRAGQWERSARAMQRQARALLARGQVRHP